MGMEILYCCIHNYRGILLIRVLSACPYEEALRINVAWLVAWSTSFLLAGSLSDLACPITNICNRTGQIGQFGPETVIYAINKCCEQLMIYEHFIIDTIKDGNFSLQWQFQFVVRSDGLNIKQNLWTTN